MNVKDNEIALNWQAISSYIKRYIFYYILPGIFMKLYIFKIPGIYDKEILTITSKSRMA